MQNSEHEFSFRHYFHPLTTLKALHILVFLGLIVFANNLFNDFVWDDIPFITDNPEVHAIHPILSFGNNYFNNSGYYRPIPAIYFSIIYALSHQTTFLYHMVQLTLHILCTSFLFVFLKRFFRISSALILSSLFLVHPIQVESVSYIAASQSELFFLPGISALLISTGKTLSTRSLFYTGILLLWSLLTKETGLLFLFLILFYTLLFEKKRLKACLVMGGAVLGLYASLRFLVGGVFFGKLGFAPITQLPFGECLINLPSVAWYYLKTLLFPSTLAIDQQWLVLHIAFIPLIGTLVFIILLGTLGYFVFQRKQVYIKPYLFFLFWFGIGFVMLLQIFPLDMTVADRWFYFPFAGLLGLVGIGLEQITWKKLQPSLFITAGCLILLLSVRTMVRNTNWHNLYTLYSHDTPISDNFDNENNYAIILTQQGKVKEALSHFLKANALHATEFTLRNTGVTYQKLGKKEKALIYLQKAYTARSYVLPPHYHQTLTYEAFAKYYLSIKNYPTASEILNAGIQDYPTAVSLWYTKALSDYVANHPDDALVAARKAYELSPGPETQTLYTNLSNHISFTVTF